ncbi:MAG: aldehyde dehydrogenase family protein [bacterium]|nr:aldehyde dehydrogenase family protein [bacterium]
MKKLISTNPARNYEPIGSVDISTLSEIRQKVAMAQKAKTLWKELGVIKRIEFLKSICEEFETRRDEISLLTTKETGRALKESKTAINDHLDKFKWFLDNAQSAISDEITHEDEKFLHKITYEPIGVAAVITPWNHPFGMFVWGVIPNLLAGNTVVFKISEECPLTGKLIEKIMINHQLPNGVFSEIYGAGDIGWKLANENINLIWFTGSTKAGHELYKLAGEKFIKAILELGGSNPGIVFEDADIQEIVSKIYTKRFKMNGQTCDALKRLIVHRSIFDEVVEKLKNIIESRKVGNPEDQQTDTGSLVAKRQLILLESQVKDAVDKGAKIITGGKKPDNLHGAFYAPTILTNITTDMRVWREEVFGPVLPIIFFQEENEAIALANDTKFGLGALVFTRDKERAKRVAGKIESGTVEINLSNHWLHCNPFGGYKNSGMGREHGKYGFRELTQLKVISLEK